MRRTPSFIPIHIHPIVVIRGRRSCVHKNLSIAKFKILITKKKAFIQFTLDPPPKARPVATIAERSLKAGLGFATWTENVSLLLRHLKKRPGCIWFGKFWVCGPASTIWATLKSENMLMDQTFLEAYQNLQGRISLGKTTCSDASSSPSWTHCQHNWDIVKFEKSYLPQKWHRRLYGLLRTLL